jgi:hypothetical protein
MEAKNEDYGTTGSAFDVMEEFTLEQAAAALVFALTGRYVPALPTALTSIGKAYHDWLNVLKAAIYSDPPDHLQASVYEGDKTKTIYLLRDDFRRWCEHRGMKPAFLFSTPDAAPKFGDASGSGELATTSEVRTAFASAAGNSFDQFKRALEDAPGWIKDARRARAGKGKSAGYLWDVAVLAEAITEHYKLNRKTMHAAIAAQWPNAADSFAL